MLDAAQLEARTRGIGGSDAHVLAHIDGPGKKTMLDLWTQKRRGKDMEHDPIVPPEHDEDKPFFHGKLYAKAGVMDVGNAFESSVVALYEDATGLACYGAASEIRDDKPWMRANADRIVGAFHHGLEGKMVGRWGVYRWAGESVPGYVICQVQWCMAVFDLDRWDVCAWLNGTDVRIATVHRDEVMIDGLAELAERFWIENCHGDKPPRPQDADDLVRFLGRRFPKDNGKIVELKRGGDNDALAEQVELLARKLALIKETAKAVDEHKKETEAKLIAVVGEDKGVAGPWGKYSYGGRAGRLAWKRIAEEVNGGPVDQDTIERHRGASYRQGDLRMFKPKQIGGAK